MKIHINSLLHKTSLPQTTPVDRYCWHPLFHSNPNALLIYEKIFSFANHGWELTNEGCSIMPFTIFCNIPYCLEKMPPSNTCRPWIDAVIQWNKRLPWIDVQLLFTCSHNLHENTKITIATSHRTELSCSPWAHGCLPQQMGHHPRDSLHMTSSSRFSSHDDAMDEVMAVFAARTSTATPPSF